MYKILYSRKSKKDYQKLKRAKLDGKVKELLKIIKDNPFQTTPPYEKLVGNLKGSYSRRISLQHRLVYEVKEKEALIRVSRMWSHYE